MRTLRWTSDIIKDKIRNDRIIEEVRVVSIKEKLMENRLWWYGHNAKKTFGGI